MKGSTMPTKNEIVEFAGCAAVIIFIISLCFI
jgi:hypothetical protein